MEIKKIGNDIIIYDAPRFSLKDTFECGQCFRWEKEGDKFHGIAYSREVYVYFDDRGLVIENSCIEDVNNIWIKYFDLERDYEKIRENLCRIDPVLLKACSYCPGIRILKQDPWEALCSFIISQNNNIPRIKGIISRLCANFGEKQGEMYKFPSADKLASLEIDKLASIRSGFRDKYILDAAKKVSDGRLDLEMLAYIPIDKARQALMGIHGVGAKVAECVLLYGFHRLEAFPLDVWMKRVMSVFFPGKTPEMFGECAGIAQQYLFHYSRENPERLLDLES